jgi:hypothetical protein
LMICCQTKSLGLESWRSSLWRGYVKTYWAEPLCCEDVVECLFDFLTWKHKQILINFILLKCVVNEFWMSGHDDKTITPLSLLLSSVLFNSRFPVWKNTLLTDFPCHFPSVSFHFPTLSLSLLSF